MQRGSKWLVVFVACSGFLVALAAGNCSGGQSGETTLTVATGVDITTLDPRHNRRGGMPSWRPTCSTACWRATRT